jgi:TM2 domain-containing membrane protein YozV
MSIFPKYRESLKSTVRKCNLRSIKGMEQQEYKSPWSALLWSFALPGFGQIYNGQYILGIVLILMEIAVNSMATLNLSLLHTYHWDLKQSHDVVNYQWGLFYPSIWGFSMWHGFNKAKAINHYLKHQGIVPPTKQAHFLGLFFGLVAGMHIGLLMHPIMKSPVLSGLCLGITGAILGHLIEHVVHRAPNKRKVKC